MCADVVESRGLLIAVVGPSGAGKDSLITIAREMLADDPRFLFVRRIVTRPCEPDCEDHVSLTTLEFEQASARSEFAVTWSAHGHAYGLPASAIDHVRKGGIAIANCSRAALKSIDAAFGHIEIVNVTARPGILADRIAGRGREDAATVEKRIRRSINDFPGQEKAVTVDNSGLLDDSAGKFVRTLKEFAHTALEYDFAGETALERSTQR